MLASLCAAALLASGSGPSTNSPPATGPKPDVVYRGERLQLTLPSGWKILESSVRPSKADAHGIFTALRAESGGGYQVTLFFDLATEVGGDFIWTLVPDKNGRSVERIKERPICTQTKEACLAEAKTKVGMDGDFWCGLCGHGDGRLDIWAGFEGDEAYPGQRVAMHLGHDKREDADQMVLRRIAMSLKVRSPADRVAESTRQHGLEIPEAAIAWRTGTSPNTTPSFPVLRNCLVYRSYAVLWTDDGSFGGVSAIEVRARATAAKPSEACADAFAGQRLLAGDPDPITGGAPMGVLGHWLVLDGLTCHEAKCGFGLVDLKTGKKALNAAFHSGRELRFSLSSGGVIASYWATIEELPCVPRRGETICWRQILEQVGVPLGAKVPQPDCEQIVGELGADRLARAFMVAIHVQRSLPAGELKYLGDRPWCGAAP
jgi:hypothetical protein